MEETYVFDIYGHSAAGSPVTSEIALDTKVQITVHDPDDNIGIGDNDPATETGTLPTITAVSDPAYNHLIGQTVQFAGQFAYSGDGTTTGEYSAWNVRIGGSETWAAGHPDNPDYVETKFQANEALGRFSRAASVQEFEGQVVCFTRDTLIDTDQGEMAVQDLTAGMMVRTRDNGMQPIRWIGSTKRAALGKLAPIKIAAGTLGNTRDLRVSPQHRMVLEGWRAELLFGEAEVLAPAKALINDETIVREEGGQVEYFHILFDQHEIIFAEGSATESFHPGDMGWSAMDAATRNEILELFPQLDTDFDSYGPSARMSVKGQDAAVLAEFLK